MRVMFLIYWPRDEDMRLIIIIVKEIKRKECVWHRDSWHERWICWSAKKSLMMMVSKVGGENEKERVQWMNKWGSQEWINEGKRIKGTRNEISVGDPLSKNKTVMIKTRTDFSLSPTSSSFTHSSLLSSLQDQRKNTSSVSASKASWEKQEQGRRPCLKTEMEATTFLSHQKKKQSKDEEVTEWATSESLKESLRSQSGYNPCLLLNKRMAEKRTWEKVWETTRIGK